MLKYLLVEVIESNNGHDYLQQKTLSCPIEADSNKEADKLLSAWYSGDDGGDTEPERTKTEDGYEFFGYIQCRVSRVMEISEADYNVLQKFGI